MIKALQERIELLQKADKIEQLTKGYSHDKKYIVYGDNDKYLLRVATSDSYVRKKEEFRILQEMQRLDVAAPMPLDRGIFEELNVCYTLCSYIDGIDAKEALDHLTAKEQYEIGVQAGKELRKMHELRAPATINPWHKCALEKHERYVEAYKECGIKIIGDEKVLQFIEQHKGRIKDRPNRFQHDDFHLGNMIVQDRQYAGVIDFGNFDYGDPIHDFVKVALFQRESSVPFSSGQIDGYFNKNVPEDFWLLYSIYAGMVIFSSVVWSIRFTPEQLEEMKTRLYRILEDHKNFEIIKPKWFKEE